MNKSLQQVFQEFSRKFSQRIAENGCYLSLFAIISMDENPEYWEIVTVVSRAEKDEIDTSYLEKDLIAFFIEFFKKVETDKEENVCISKFSVLTEDDQLFKDIKRILESQGDPRELFNVELDGATARNVVVIKSPVDKRDAFVRWEDLIKLIELIKQFDQLPSNLRNGLSLMDITQKYLIFQQTGHVMLHRDKSHLLLDSKPLNKQEEYDDE